MSDLVERLRQLSFMLKTLQTMGDIVVGKGEAPFEAVDAGIAEITRLQKELETARNLVANSATAIESAREWLSCVEPHLRDGHPFKRDYAVISGILAALKDKEVAG